MCQTLFTIPHQIYGIPVFGFGWALLLWAIFSVGVVIASAQRRSFRQAIAEWAPFLAIAGVLIALVLPAIEVTGVDESGDSARQGLAIRGYGVLLGAAILSAMGLAMVRARTKQIPQDTVLNLSTWLVISGILGGRIFYVIQYWDEYRGDNLLNTLGNALNFAQGGLVVYGAFLGGFVGGCAFVLRHRLSFKTLADLVAPSLMLGLAIGRLGCFCNGCCHGGPTDHVWGVSFPVESVPYVEHRSQGRLHGFQLGFDAQRQLVIQWVRDDSAAAQAGLKPGVRVWQINGVSVQPTSAETEWTPEQAERAMATAESVLLRATPNITVATPQGDIQWVVDPWPERTERIQPTQLFSAISAGLICLMLLAAEPFLRRPGDLFGLLITIYPPTRFLLEMIRVDESAVGMTGLTISQNISLVILVLALGFWWYQSWSHRTTANRRNECTMGSQVSDHARSAASIPQKKG